jgi:hypothetical protein
MLGLVAALGSIVQQTSQIAGAVRSHPDGEIFPGLFRDTQSVICAAGLLATGIHGPKTSTGEPTSAVAITQDVSRDHFR